MTGGSGEQVSQHCYHNIPVYLSGVMVDRWVRCDMMSGGSGEQVSQHCYHNIPVYLSGVMMDRWVGVT